MRLGPKGLIGLGRPKALVNVGGGRLQGASSPPPPPSGFGWVVFNDPASGNHRLVTYTDPSTGEQRPVIGSLS